MKKTIICSLLILSSSVAFADQKVVVPETGTIEHSKMAEEKSRQYIDRLEKHQRITGRDDALKEHEQKLLKSLEEVKHPKFSQ